MKHLFALRRFPTLALGAGLCLAGVVLAADKPGELLKPDAPKALGDFKPMVAPPSPIKWTKSVLSTEFFSEGAAAGDFNHDGKMDVVSGPYWYAGPNFSPDKKHAFYEPKKFDPKGYSKNFFCFVYDFNGDGWDDIMVYGFPGEDASWFENPKSPDSDKPWARHKVLDIVSNESPTFTDIDGDGKPDIVCISNTTKDGGQYGYATADWKHPENPWTFHAISPREKGYQRFTHGMGVGDVNGDGKLDLLEKDGWWEQPKDLANDPVWKKHPAKFGNGGAQIYAYDVNGDGRMDVITSIEAHRYGLAWYEQNADGSFVQHLIMGQKPEENVQGLNFSQLHAIDLIDVDGDGIKDLVTGKRYWAHGPGGDVDANKPPVLYWFKLTRENGKAQFTGYPIDEDSGIGTQVLAIDLNGDKKPDIVVGNKKGTFIHIQQPATVATK